MEEIGIVSAQKKITNEKYQSLRLFRNKLSLSPELAPKSIKLFENTRHKINGII
jgi:hypothetical protein